MPILIPIQILGLLIGLAALHLSYLYYKRRDFTKYELIFWGLIWVVFLFVVSFPQMLQPLTQFLELPRAFDLITIVAFVILLALTFRTYVITNRTRRKFDELVRALALEDSEQLSIEKEETKKLPH